MPKQRERFIHLRGRIQTLNFHYSRMSKRKEILKMYMFNLDIPLVEKNLYQFTIYKIKIFVLRVLLRNISVTVKFDMGLFKSHWQFIIYLQI
jgi:hypothetical protein